GQAFARLLIDLADESRRIAFRVSTNVVHNREDFIDRKTKEPSQRLWAVFGILDIVITRQDEPLPVSKDGQSEKVLVQARVGCIHVLNRAPYIGPVRELNLSSYNLPGQIRDGHVLHWHNESLVNLVEVSVLPDGMGF